MYERLVPRDGDFGRDVVFKWWNGVGTPWLFRGACPQMGQGCQLLCVSLPLGCEVHGFALAPLLL